MDDGRIDLVSGLDVEHVVARLAQALRVRDVGNRALAFYLWDMAERKLCQRLGYPDAVTFARNELGLGERRAQELLWAGRRLLELKGVDRAFRDAEICWSQVRTLLRVATVETERSWVQTARDVDCRHLARLAARARPGEEPARGHTGQGGLPDVTYRLVVELDSHDYEVWMQAKRKLQAEMGAPLRDEDVVRAWAQQQLGTRADGTVPGRVPVDDSIYRVVVEDAEDASSAHVRGADRALAVEGDAQPDGHDEPGSNGRNAQVRGGTRNSDSGPPARTNHDAGPDASASSEHGSGSSDAGAHVRGGDDSTPTRGVEREPGSTVNTPTTEAAFETGRSVPMRGSERHEREAQLEAARSDARVPAPLRRRVLARDGHRCRRCGRTARLQVHHIVWRRYGGPTTFRNLLTLCAHCHALVHARQLFVERRPGEGVRFRPAVGVDAGRMPVGPRMSLSLAAGPSFGAHVRAPDVTEGDDVLTIEDVPAVVTPEWFLANQHRFTRDLKLRSPAQQRAQRRRA